MPKWTGQARQLVKVIKPYGMHLEQTRKHTWVMKGEQRIISCSTTPSDRNAYKNTIRWLIKLGHLPESERWRH